MRAPDMSALIHCGLCTQKTHHAFTAYSIRTSTPSTMQQTSGIRARVLEKGIQIYVMEASAHLAPEASTGEVGYMGQLPLCLLHGHINKPKCSLDLPLTLLLGLGGVQGWCVNNGLDSPAVR